MKAYEMVYGHKPELSHVRSISSDLIFHATVNTFIKKLVKKKMCSTDIQLAWMLHYNDLWGVDIEDKDNPFGGVGYYEREDLYGSDNPYEVRLKLYIDYDVKKYTGLNLIEFMQLNRTFQKQIMDVCLEQKKKDDKNTSKLLEELEKADNRE